MKWPRTFGKVWKVESLDGPIRATVESWRRCTEIEDPLSPVERDVVISSVKWKKMSELPHPVSQRVGGMCVSCV